MSVEARKAEARVDWDFGGVKIMARVDRGGQWFGVQFGDVTYASYEEGVEIPSDAMLRIDDDLARAMYEALAEYFGHTGHDIRALRKDYEAERGRVDRLIGAVIKGSA